MTNHAKNPILSTQRTSDPYVPTAAPKGVHQATPFPPVEPNSQQRAGETMNQFFERRAKANADRATRETVQARESRLQQEKNASTGAVPGRKGARVYVWEKSNGFYIRRAAGRSNYEDVWDEYGPLQRRYNSFQNEWDVCEAFGPEGGDDDDDDGDDDGGEDGLDGHDGYDFRPFEEDDDPDAPSEPFPDRPDLEDGQLPLALPSHTSDATAEYKVVTASFSDAAYMRFGCLLPKTAVQSQGLQLPPSDEVYDIPRNLGLLDFHDQTQEIYCVQWNIEVHREFLNGQLHFVISERNHDSDLYVLLESATTALEIVRQGWGPSLKDVIEPLLARGMRFRVCFRATKDRTPTPPARRLYSGLGYRSPNYKADAQDYQAYVTIRDQFFLSPRGRAALLHGGLIARLARPMVSDEDVLRGPTDDATVDGIRLWDGRSPSAYWDDSLTDHEIDLICGVYHVSTGAWSFFFSFFLADHGADYHCRASGSWSLVRRANIHSVLVAQTRSP
ncbi:hypothetical protein DFH06DRAFT_977454 [Mycena polygramma]|nr:hypothetical protein DFH06DRAFT_977454 [Mycena polygramma]